MFSRDYFPADYFARDYFPGGPDVAVTPEDETTPEYVCGESSLANSIFAAALGPKKIKSDAGEVEQYGLAELIAADQYLKAQCASDGALNRSSRGLRFTKLVPPGSV